MFPRISLLYRFIAVCLFVCVFIMILNTNNDMTGHKRFPYLHQHSLRELQSAQVDTSGNAKGRTTHANITTPLPTLKTNFYPEPVVNPHDFHYIFNPSDMCNKTGIKFVIYVHSAPKNYKKRQMVRQTWGSRAVLAKYKMRLVFVMGIVKDRLINEAIIMENDQYGDLVVEDFLDSYRNLTYKAVAALKWVSTYCANTVYVIKSDDDILIDMHSLMDHMNSTTVRNYGTRSVILCNQWLRMKVIRDKKSKWYISKEEFSEEYFPPYCSGSAFVMSVDVVQAMYKASFHTEFFWVDDFYITGLLARKLNLQHQRLNDGYILNAKVALEKLTDDKKHQLKFFHVNKLTHIYKMWNILRQKSNTTCDDECFTWSPEVIKPT